MASLLTILASLWIGSIYYATWRGYQVGLRKGYRHKEPPHCPTCECGLHPTGDG